MNIFQSFPSVQTSGPLTEYLSNHIFTSIHQVATSPKRQFKTLGLSLLHTHTHDVHKHTLSVHNICTNFPAWITINLSYSLWERFQGTLSLISYSVISNITNSSLFLSAFSNYQIEPRRPNADGPFIISVVIQGRIICH